MDARQPPGVAPSGVAYVMRLGPGDVGARVVLRHRLPSGGLTDVLGVLTAWSAERATVQTRHGPVDVAVADLVAGKQVPPAPVRRPPPGPEPEAAR